MFYSGFQERGDVWKMPMASWPVGRECSIPLSFLEPVKVMALHNYFRSQRNTRRVCTPPELMDKEDVVSEAVIPGEWCLDAPVHSMLCGGGLGGVQELLHQWGCFQLASKPEPTEDPWPHPSLSKCVGEPTVAFRFIHARLVLIGDRIVYQRLKGWWTIFPALILGNVN